jgi:tRNA 2-selenouridine synthase
MREISFLESLEIKNSVYIDVRSPAEFKADHVSGSLNIPLFDNNERKEIGTIYRLAGRYDAVMRGTEIVGEKLKGIMHSILEHKNKNLLVMCARGGMRSGSLVSLLDSLGLPVYKIEQGYKGYRRFVIDSLRSLKLDAPLFVLQGLTGSGKTEVIRRIRHTIDLEDMAGHRSSVFGGIDNVQRTQKRFESLLLDRFRGLERAPYILIEGESRKIGNLHIPDVLFEFMKRSPVVYLDTPIERRVEIIYEEYHDYCDNTNIPAIVKGLGTKLGKKNTDDLISLYTRGKIREFIRLMLNKYYDPLYQYSLDKKNYFAVIFNNNADDAAAEVEHSIKEYIKKTSNVIDNKRARL